MTSAGVSVAGETEDRIADLERQLAELKAAVMSNGESITVNQADIEEARPSKKGTKFQYGGFIQLDASMSDYSEGKPNGLIEDFLVPSLIPTSDGSADSYTTTNLHAKTSRLFFTTATDTDAGKISSRIEMDFLLSGHGDERISNSWNSRLRHAFVKWDYDEGKSLLAGQSWSTFFNVGALPDQLDFVGPVGSLFNRQPQIRWTMGGLQLAVESPATRLNRNVWVDPDPFDDDDTRTKPTLDTSFDNFHEGIPDLVARYNGKSGDLNWSLAAIVRELNYENRDDAIQEDSSTAVEGDSDQQIVYGLSLAGKWMLGKDDLRFMVNYGDGLGRYLGLNSFNDGYVDANGDIEAIDQWGGFVAYRHYWSPQWRSSFSLSASAADNPSVSEFLHANSLAESYQSFHASLNYLPAPNMLIGGEYIYASKELESGADGDMSRLQFAVKYGF